MLMRLSFPARLAIFLLACAALLPVNAKSADRTPGTGLLREDPVQYERFRSVPAYRDYLPDHVDLSDLFPEAGDQGSQGSCTAWSVSYGLRSFYRNVETQSRPAQGLSPGFVYNQLKTDRNDCAEPIRISDALKFLEKRGTVPFEAFPYRESACSDLPDPGLQSLAQENKIDGWRRLQHDRLDDIKGQLSKGNPVVIGMLVDESLVDLKPDGIYDEQVAGAPDFIHAMVLVGYDERKRAFRAFNSWGSGWADNGMGWLSYRSVFSDIDSAFVAEVADYSDAKLAAARTALDAAKIAAVPQEPEQKPEPEPLAKKEPKPQPAVVAKPAIVTKPTIEPNMVQGLAPRPSLLSGQWKADLASVAGGFDCANLSMEIKNGFLRSLNGFVALEEDLAQLGRVLSSHTETQQAALKVRVRPWPQCEALNTFARTFARPQGLGVATVTADRTQTAVFEQDDYLGIRITTPDFPAYLYVTYLQSGGDAVHLVGWQKGGKQHLPGTEVYFGLDPKAPRFRVAPPFGKEMVIVVASSDPLFEAEYDIVEEERAYLTRFRQRMLDIGNGAIKGRFAAGAAYLATKPAD
ncbi:C1 family peptidase [Hwanghaeella sp.]|uniref:C1 family peptidase n=1 Tax=Hwanghaeella sp. TaxID=2605943 RepID=UPI003CCBCCF3